MDLAFWENELKLGTRRQHKFNCEWCERHGLWSGRRRQQCFKHFDVCYLPQAKITPQGFRLDKSVDVSATAEQTLATLVRLREANPDRSAFEICRMLGVCPTGLLDQEDWHFLALEGAVREYGANYLHIYGLDPVPAVVLDALQVIRQTRNEIEARNWKRIKERQN